MRAWIADVYKIDCSRTEKLGVWCGALIYLQEAWFDLFLFESGVCNYVSNVIKCYSWKCLKNLRITEYLARYW